MIEEIDQLSWRYFVALIRGLSPQSALVAKLGKQANVIEDDAGVDRFFSEQLRAGT